MANFLENQYDNENFVDYYEILEVDTEATTEEIKKQYIKLAKKYHPDQKDGSSEKFQLITKAFEVLNNKETRKNYDLYYLKKSYDEIKEDNFKSLKDQFTEFITLTDKKMDKKELDKIYNDIFKDRTNYIEQQMNEEEIYKRLNDIKFEREANDIETNNETLKNILENNPNLEMNDVMEYLNDTTQKNKQIINKEVASLDLLPNYFNNNCSFLNDNENIDNCYYSRFETETAQTKIEQSDFNVEEFSKWKNNKTPNTKLEDRDIDLYLARKQQEEELKNEVDINLASNVKRKNVEKFLHFDA